MKSIAVLSIILISSIVSLGQDEPKGKIHGYMFGDYYYNLDRDNNSSSISYTAEKGEKDLNAFQFRRIYFEYDYNISSTFSSRFRLEANQKENTSGGKIGLFVKDAYLKWKNIVDGSDLIVGFSPTPTFGVSESYWGYRSLSKTIMDLRKIASSRDFGVAAKGKINNSGSIKYWVMAANGEGNKPEDDKQKSVYGHVAIQPVKDFTITFYGDYRGEEDITDPNSAKSLSNNVFTTALFAGYKKAGEYSLGIEGFYQSQQNELSGTNGLEIESSMGISFFGSADLSEKFSIVGRYDYFDPISNSGYEGDVRNYFLAALNYKADPKVWIMPNIVMETYENLPDGTEFDSAITGRVTFFYKFN
jgi:hypothetical protein